MIKKTEGVLRASREGAHSGIFQEELTLAFQEVTMSSSEEAPWGLEEKTKRICNNQVSTCPISRKQKEVAKGAVTKGSAHTRSKDSSES